MADAADISDRADVEAGKDKPITDALTNFALAWIRQWQKNGGQILFDPERDIIHLIAPDYGESKAYRDDLELQRKWRRPISERQEAGRKNDFGWHYYGRMRALMELLDDMPAGRLAVDVVAKIAGFDWKPGQ